MPAARLRPRPTADPYADTDVIDARAPRFLQATVGVLSLVALVTGWWPLFALLALQLLLGMGSFVSRFTSVWIPGGQATMLMLPVAHRLVASLILGAAVIAAVRALSARRPERAPSVSDAPRLRLVRG